MDPITTLVHDALGDSAYLKIDRGEGLFVVNDEGYRALTSSDVMLFSAVRRGQMWSIAPTEHLLQPYGLWALQQIDPGALTLSLMTHRGKPVSSSEISLWIEGVKRILLHDSGGYERHLRTSAAQALRQKCGGALWVCGACLDIMIDNDCRRRNKCCEK